MDEILTALQDWFEAEYYLKTVCSSGRTTEGSHYYREVEDRANYERKNLAELIQKGGK